MLVRILPKKIGTRLFSLEIISLHSIRRVIHRRHISICQDYQAIKLRNE